MFAIIRTGGKQYRVQPGDVIRVEKLENELGSEFDISDILMVGGETPVVGQPTVSGAKVTVVVTKQTRDRKVIIFKKKRRQGYRRFKTHRQHFTELFVKAISHAGKTEKSEGTANVVNVDEKRAQQIAARSEKSNAKKTAGGEMLEKVAKKTAVKKMASKPKSSAGKKKAGAAKSKKKVAVATKKKAAAKK